MGIVGRRFSGMRLSPGGQLVTPRGVLGTLSRDGATKPLTYGVGNCKGVSRPVKARSSQFDLAGAQGRAMGLLRVDLVGTAIADVRTADDQGRSRVFGDRKLITPGDAANSYLIKKMEGASDIEGDVMPPSGSISQERINRVRRWIDDL